MTSDMIDYIISMVGDAPFGFEFLLYIFALALFIILFKIVFKIIILPFSFLRGYFK